MSGVILGWPLERETREFGFIKAEAAARTQPAPPDGAPIGDASEAHTLVVAPTGSGKGRSLVLPNLLHWPHSALKTSAVEKSAPNWMTRGVSRD